MNITTTGVELDSEELIRFFQDHCETASAITLYDRNGLVMGAVTAITNDDRMVLDVDIPASDFLFSNIFRTVRVVADSDREYHLTIIN